MRFRAFYASIYNIHLRFIKIEIKTGREEARAKLAKKTSPPRQSKVSSRRSGSPKRSIHSPRQSRQLQEDRSRVRLGEQTFA